MEVMEMTPSGFRESWTAPRPKSMAGISVEVVPFQPSQDGNRPGRWMPEPKMTGPMAEKIPARITAAGRRTPNSTTDASQSRPVVTVTERLVMLRWLDAYMTPPTPAMAAERANTPSFTRRTDTPEVLAATSEDRVAAMAR